MPARNPPTPLPPPDEPRPLLPIPCPADVEGFIELYMEKYGIELEPAKAHETLTGLMQFLYLTGRQHEEVGVEADGDGHVASPAA